MNKTKPVKKIYMGSNFGRFFDKQSLEDKKMINDYLVNRDKWVISQQAEHFVELGEEMKCDVPPKNNIATIDEALKYAGRFNYNKAISDFQEAIKNEK